MIARKELAKLWLLALFVLMGPTVGDVGSCGQDVVELDAFKFFSEKAFIDCRQCRDCGFASLSCVRACEGVLENVAFDPDCFPLVHDGEVCLNALRAASCNDYANYVDDLAPTVPTECNFCPLAGKPGGG
jgi:hypothetical protein